jgi:hypothetical protein
MLQSLFWLSKPSYVSDLNGEYPVSRANIITPILNTSDFSEYGYRSNISGAMYPAVP